MDSAQRALNSMSRKEGEFTLLLDEQFDIVWHSESLSGILGWGDVRGRNSTEFVHPDDLELALETMMQMRDAGEDTALSPPFAPESADIRVADVNGGWHSFETTAWNHLDDGDVRGVLCTCRRVHDRSDLAGAIELLGSGADVQTVIPVIARLADRSMGGAEVRTAFAWRHDDRIVVVSAEGEAPLDPGLANAARLVWSENLRTPIIITDLDDPLLQGAGDIAVAAGYRGAFIVPIGAPTGSEIIGAMVAWSASTVDFQAPTQSPVHVALRLAALAIADHRTKRSLRWAANHDPLTGLANRAEFARCLDEASTGDLVLLYIDLDDFKPINDAYGHPVGDLVLREVGRRIASVIGPHDTVGRLGGDEFAVVCVGMSDPAEGRAVGDRIVEAIRVPLLASGLHLTVGASVGVAVGAQPLIPAMLARRADEALYIAKNSGKNTVCLAS
jgi:diguanylate cyclase (GGDEF)-like protein/PAS domain S-box-containing protein